MGWKPMLRGKANASPFAHVLVKRLDQPLGDRPRLAGADDAAVDLRDRRDLGAGAGDEALVGRVQVVRLDRPLDARDLQAAAEVDDRLAGDTLEDAVDNRWRADLAIADDEEVISRALGDVAEVVDHDRLGHARV